LIVLGRPEYSAMSLQTSSANLLERLRAVHSHKVVDLRSLAKERLPAIFKLSESFLLCERRELPQGIPGHHKLGLG